MLFRSPLQALHAAGPLESDEEALFMPGTARPTADGRIEVDVHAWVFEREHRWGLDAALARYLGMNLKKLTPAARLRFSQRTALFHAESEEDKVIDVVFDGSATRLTMPPSGADVTGWAKASWLKSYEDTPLHLDSLHHLQAWYERVKSREAVQKSILEEGLDLN